MKWKDVILSLVAAVLFAGVGLLLPTSTAHAAPAAPVEIPLTQPDGTTFTARQWGDERQHGMETLDGYTILQDAQSKLWVYAVVQDGKLVSALNGSSPRVVGRDAPAGITPHARPALSPGSLGQQPLAQRSSPALAQNSGVQSLLLIFVNYANAHRSYPIRDFMNQAFAASGSIRDYYSKASFGKLVILPAQETNLVTNDGIIEVTLPGNHPNNLPQLVSATIAKNALLAADKSILFSSFDKDGNHAITSAELHILFIVAGYEGSYCGDATCPGPAIWGHHTALETPPVLDGVKVGADSSDGKYGGYAMIGEIHGLNTPANPNHIAQIGIMVHELGNDLSWPDLYDIDYTSQGVGDWSVMGSGSWNGFTYAGDTPALPDAYLKWYQGWIQPANPFNGRTYSLTQAATSKDTLLLGVDQPATTWKYNRDYGTGEFFLAENRQKVGYDAALPGCGILIWHIDETVSFEDDANAEDFHPLVMLEQADGQWDLNMLLEYSNPGDAGDPWPGSTNNLEFGYTTIPNSQYYNDTDSERGLRIDTQTCAVVMNVIYTGPEIGPDQPERIFIPEMMAQ